MSRLALKELTQRVSGSDTASEVEFVGRDPVLPTRFRIGEAAAVALGGVGAAVSDLWELRTGRRQRVRVPVRGAAASLLSFAFQRLEGRPTPRPALTNPTVAMYPTRDGRWIHLHGGFPALRDGTLQLLGCADETPAIAAAVSRWRALELEDALAKARLCGAVIRTAAEWASHAQGRALAALPVVEVIRVADSPPEPLEPERAGGRPLSGVRALDLTRVLAGPACARTLAEHGADVLKITSPRLPSIEPFVIDTGHGKLSAQLHLRWSEDAKRLRALVRGADVFSEGYRTGALERLGFGPRELVELRPGLIYVSINCYGHAGPWSARPGWEQLAQSVTGLAAEHGTPEHPRLVPAAACDYTTGYLAAYGALVALARRAREGGSYLVRASLAQTGMWIRGLGRVGDSLALEPRADPGFEGAATLLTDAHFTETDTPHGRLRHLAPVVELSQTPGHWARPTVPLGTHPPAWPD